MEADFAHIVYYPSTREVVDGRGGVVGGAGVVVDVGIGVDDGDFDSLVSCQEDG